jgi:hypothetical protein
VSISSTQTKYATAVLAGAALLFAAPALANNGGATHVNPLQVEQLGPKNLLHPTRPQAGSITPATRAMLEDEFGPKYLLGYELKAAQS